MKAKTSGKKPITASKKDGNDDSFTALKNALKYSLDIFKLKEETEVGRKIAELAIRRMPQNWSNDHKWLCVAKIIADVCAENDRHTVSQTPSYDFLTLASNQVDKSYDNIYAS